jgi:hypothetical protein
MSIVTRLAAIGLCVALAALFTAPVGAQVARPTDAAVSKMMESMQKSVKQFEKNLPSDFKRSTLRGEKTDVNVENFMKDFNKDIERLRERFKPTYSASADVAAVLHKATKVDAFVKSQPPSFKGRSEWDAAAAELQKLAMAYETTFPTPPDASARRVNDKEIQQAADTISKEARAYRKAIGKAYSKDEKDALAAAQKSADGLSKAADSLSSRSQSGKPASGEAGVLAEALAAVETAVAGKTLPESATAAWGRISTAAQTIEQAFRPAGA